MGANKLPDRYLGIEEHMETCVVLEGSSNNIPMRSMGLKRKRTRK